MTIPSRRRRSTADASSPSSLDIPDRRPKPRRRSASSSALLPRRCSPIASLRKCVEASFRSPNGGSLDSMKSREPNASSTATSTSRTSSSNKPKRVGASQACWIGSSRSTHLRTATSATSCAIIVATGRATNHPSPRACVKAAWSCLPTGSCSRASWIFPHSANCSAEPTCPTLSWRSSSSCSTKPSPMAERSASMTARGVAMLRAAHQLIDAPPPILDDPVIVRLLGPDAEARIRSEVERAQSAPARGIRSHVKLHSRYTEDRLHAAVGRGVDQYVLLGAGLDTFAYRQPHWARSLTIIEVDHPSSQADKRRLLATAGVDVPSNVRYADVDFEHETLADGLRRAGVDFQRPTFFSWLGVTMSLTRA